MPTLKPAPKAPLRTSSAGLLDQSSPLGWRHMPTFGSGYLSYVSASIDWPATPSDSAQSPTLRFDNFWSSVAHPD